MLRHFFYQMKPHSIPAYFARRERIALLDYRCVGSAMFLMDHPVHAACGANVGRFPHRYETGVFHKNPQLGWPSEWMLGGLRGTASLDDTHITAVVLATVVCGYVGKRTLLRALGLSELLMFKAWDV
jgi:hypothetical protein